MMQDKRKTASEPSDAPPQFSKRRHPSLKRAEKQSMEMKRKRYIMQKIAADSSRFKKYKKMEVAK
jgi:hypothetical protein